MSNETTTSSISIPQAVVVAGLLIAAAVIFSNSSGAGSSAQKENLGLGSKLYTELARASKLSVKDFAACQEESVIASRVASDYQNGVDAGVRGTPFSVIIAPNGNYIGVSGSRDIGFMKNVLAKAFAGEYVTDMLTNNKGVLVEDLTGILRNTRAVDPNEHIIGNKNAALTIIEYSDFQCPYCAQFHPTLQNIVSTDPAIAWVYRHFPLPNHPEALPAAIASECAAKLGGNEVFWEYATALFANQ